MLREISYGAWRQMVFEDVSPSGDVVLAKDIENWRVFGKRCEQSCEYFDLRIEVFGIPCLDACIETLGRELGKADLFKVLQGLYH
jgi:hypothetical protein